MDGLRDATNTTFVVLLFIIIIFCVFVIVLHLLVIVFLSLCGHSVSLCSCYAFLSGSLEALCGHFASLCSC